jgi:RNA-directed DNA polymerase
MTSNNRQTVTNIVVNKKPQVVFHKRNYLRQALYYIKKFGFEEYRGYKVINQKNYIKHLLRKINFVLQINTKDVEFLAYKSLLKNLEKKQYLKAMEDEVVIS